MANKKKEADASVDEVQPKKKKKYGGRQAGTVNKVTSMTKEIIASMLGEYQASGLMTEDFNSLTPKDRIMVAERLSQYVLPKMQATAVDFTGATTKITIEQKLRDLAEDND